MVGIICPTFAPSVGDRTPVFGLVASTLPSGPSSHRCSFAPLACPACIGIHCTGVLHPWPPSCAGHRDSGSKDCPSQRAKCHPYCDPDYKTPPADWDPCRATSKFSVRCIADTLPVCPAPTQLVPLLPSPARQPCALPAIRTC